MSVVVNSHLSCDLWDGIHENHPSADAIFCSGYGQTFWTPSTIRYGLTEARFFMKKDGTPDGQLEARLYAVSGLCGIDGIPSGTPLAVSTPVNVATLTTGVGGWIIFTFLAPYYCMLDDTCYVIVVVLTGCTTLPAHFPSIRGGVSDHEGNGVYYRASVWNETNWDYCFYVLGESCGGGIVPDNPRMNGFDFEHIVEWDEYRTNRVKKKSPIGKCDPTVEGRHFVVMPRIIHITARTNSAEKEELWELFRECAWHPLYDRGQEFIDYVWMEEPSFRWDNSLGCGGRQWIATIGLVCSNT